MKAPALCRAVARWLPTAIAFDVAIAAAALRDAPATVTFSLATLILAVPAVIASNRS